jgi:acetyl esterase
MPLDPQVEGLLNEMAASGAPPIASMTVEEARALNPAFLAMGGEQVPVAAVRDISIPVDGATIGGRVYTPEGDGPHGIVVFFHGGGFVIGDLQSHDNVARTICRRAEAVVVAVDYRMAPEHRFPTAPKDCFAATRWVAAHAADLGADATRLAVCGDSAGGNLSAVVSQMARDAGGPVICFAALIYPTVDLTLTGGSIVENGKGYFLEKEDMDWFMGLYLNSDGDRSDVLASPALHAKLAGLPPCFITTCEFDPLRDEGEAYGEALRANGVAAENKRYDGLIHGAASMAGIVDGGRQLLDDVADRLKGALGRAQS